VRELGDLTRQLHTGRAGSDNHKGEQTSALLRIGFPLGQLERTEDAGTDLERVVEALQTGRKGGELVVAEIGLRRPRGDDQAVVANLPLRSQGLHGE
jgi:hypothetical protein